MEEIAEIIDKNYTLDNLKKLYKNYLNKYDNQERELKLDFTYVSHSEQKMQKLELVNFLASFYSDERLFKALMADLPEDVKKVFYFLIWEGGIYKAEILEKKLDVSIINAKSEKSKSINVDFMFFCFQKSRGYDSGIQFHIFMPETVRKHLKQFFEPPENFNLQPVEIPAATEFIHSEESRILDYLPIYIKFINSNLKVSKEDKPTKGSIKQFQEYASIREFYPSNSEYEFLKSELIINVIKNFTVIEAFDEPMLLLRAVLDYFLNNSSDIENDIFLSHIKGKNQLENFSDQSLKLHESLLFILKSLPVNQWINFENIEKFVLYRDIDFKFFDEEAAEKNLYIDQSTGKNNANFQKQNITRDIFNDVVVAPIIKGSFFLLSAIGVIDIAYDSPVNGIYKQRGKEFLTVFDGLKFIRLNPLGSFLTGKEHNYLKKSQNQELKITLSDQNLVINLIEKDKFSELYLESFAEKLTETKFLVTYTSFLKNCSGQEELDNKIKMFKSKVSESMPRVWDDFFRELKSRSLKIKSLNDYLIFQLDYNDSNLIELVTASEELNRNLFRMEGFRIAVNKNNIDSFKELLAARGYLLPSESN